MSVISMKQLLEGWCTLRSPNTPLEPKNEALHLYRA